MTQLILLLYARMLLCDYQIIRSNFWPFHSSYVMVAQTRDDESNIQIWRKILLPLPFYGLQFQSEAFFEDTKITKNKLPSSKNTNSNWRLAHKLVISNCEVFRRWNKLPRKSVEFCFSIYNLLSQKYVMFLISISETNIFWKFTVLCRQLK